MQREQLFLFFPSILIFYINKDFHIHNIPKVLIIDSLFHLIVDS